MKATAVSILFLCMFFSSFSQNPKIDSLKNILRNTGDDTAYVNASNDIANCLLRIGSFDSALQYTSSAMNKAQSLSFSNGIATAHIHTANIYFCQGKFENAKSNYEKAFALKKELGDKKGMASCLMGMGNASNSLSNYSEALKYHLESLKIKEELKDNKSMADSYVNIGNIYYRQKNYPAALKYYDSGLKTMMQTDNKKNIADCYNNIANVYWSQNKFEKAINNYTSSLVIVKELGDKQGTSRAFNNLGAVYFSEGKYPEALVNYFEGLKIREEIGDNEGIGNSWVNIGAVYAKTKDYKNAEAFTKKAMERAKEVGDRLVIKSGYENLAEIYRATGRHALALESYVNFIAVRDSLINDENTKNIMQLEMNYEFGKKEAALNAEQGKKEALQKEELKRHRQINWFIVCFSLLLLLVGFLLFNRYLLKQRNRFQEQAGKLEKEQAVAVMDAQEEERKRIAEDLHDSLGHLLSTIKLHLQVVSEKTDQVYHSLQLLDQASDELRTISFNLMPRTLEEEGLVSALNELASKVTSSGVLKVLLHIHNMEKFVLEKQSQFNIYRIIQEAVNNILKHANATEINIQMIGQNDHITVMIEDDGKGFDTSQNNSGRGLKNIVTRSVWLKGVINIDSTPGKGTTITTEIPL
jgi:two-component system NarL family sensor kinase